MSFSAAPLVPDFDGVWKTALQIWLPESLALFWKHIHEAIDWSLPPVFLDKELKQLGRILKKGVRHVDMLVQLRLKSGDKTLMLIHLEIQSGKTTASFSMRMLQYHVYLRQRYVNHDILSCAILLDREQGRSTEALRYSSLGCRLVFNFPVINLASWQHRMAELKALAPTNPFAVVVMAQLECRATKPDNTRLAGKLQLARALIKWNYDTRTRRLLLRIVDSLLVLPDALDELFIDTLEQTEGPAMMQRLTGIERVILRREKAASLEEGKLEGKLEGAAAVLRTQIERKFGGMPEWAALHISHADADTLQQWALKVLDADAIEEVFGRP